jgi:hypothetical protein
VASNLATIEKVEVPAWLRDALAPHRPLPER